MPSGSARAFALELGFGLALLGLACQPAARDQPRSKRSARLASASTSASVSVLPRPASSFELHGDRFVQRHPRLPDSGEWRCADRDGVVWCAGGQAPAGVAPGAADTGFRCGVRWGKDSSERVCVDTAPDYPGHGLRDCRFEQERGIERWCQAGGSQRHAAAETLPAAALPACWLSRDCGSGNCDRGACRCDRDSDCQLGRCQAGYCSGGAP